MRPRFAFTPRGPSLIFSTDHAEVLKQDVSPWTFVDSGVNEKDLGLRGVKAKRGRIAYFSLRF